ncbi:MAG: YlmC/YmxH family sporulation protein [Acidibacillus sp.]|uniref:PRC-barrel domain-containing protein n=1 Tax=Sulfoacidibacillus ferrooxidans TaxID=2005001 RepID=A0A9X1VB29_9BACL|nr:YlmC/YmxH family sporulation protein [Sulfoacidibacillus ferrooxidans]MCI0184204.1 hypothetical protein [Sulfoacidibacillus ferrooxidans]MCY0892941.1 YlmC/YmxH family sporulation protein [Acidibacillus sp.]
MRASELQAKDVINIVDGRKLGSIGDLDIDLETGLIRSMIIPQSGRFFGLMAGGEEIVIPWTQIVKIGSDVVLVDLRQGLLESNELQESRSGGHSSGY